MSDFESEKTRATHTILRGGDGPVDRFVAIQRAIDLARWAERTGNLARAGVDCPIANALHETLYGDDGDDGAWLREPDGS